jgi:type VI secretion system secreted protein VgrG
MGENVEASLGIGGLAPGDRPYQLAVRSLPSGHFTVHSFRGREALSKLYAFDINVTCSTSDETTERLSLGQPAVLVSRVGTAPRAFHGIIARVDALGAREVRDRHELRMRLVPRMWLLRRRKGSRIFQQLRIDEVVDTVCRQAGVATQWRLRRAHTAREYCTQYEETDYDFIKRILAEEGVFFHFAQVAVSDAPDAVFAGETVVFSDDAVPTPVAPPRLSYLASTGTATSRQNKVSEFVAHSQVRPTAAEFRTFDPARPQAPLVSHDSIAAVAEGTDLEVYEHHANYLFPEWNWLKDEPSLILRQKRRRARGGSGESGCPSLTAGHVFALDDHPLAHLNRSWVVTSVRHEGVATAPANATDWQVYRNRFECAPSEVTFCPRRPKQRTVLTALTATVVGPPGEEIHTDTGGRIKVHFHWDRSGSREDASCWIRTMQGWGGANWGTQFIPRVGMEVVVAFEGGDPDKPLVLGCLHNGTHPPAFPLPAEKTKSGFRTKSSPRGAGFNELSFDDAAGSEQIHIHAQRDLDEEVGRDHTEHVKRDGVTEIERNRKSTVGGDSSDLVRGKREERVLGDVSCQVEKNRVDVVTGTEDRQVRGQRTLRLESGDIVDVGGAAEHRYARDLTMRVAGNHTLIVGKHESRRSMTLRVEGTGTISTEDALVIEAKGGLTMKCGTTSIRVGADGIELNGPLVRATGENGGLEMGKDGLKLTSAGVLAHLGDKLLVKSEKASLAMGTEVKVDGQRILLNSPERATETPPPEPVPPTEIELVDHDGHPLAEQRFVIELPDGSLRTGVTNKDGKAKVDLAVGGKIRFPELTEVEPG